MFLSWKNIKLSSRLFKRVRSFKCVKIDSDSYPILSTRETIQKIKTNRNLIGRFRFHFRNS
ncbi:hypothetical protein DLM78_09620 [Leptospira stimsonii]|uniref:Uncharacterized protein n=1 Tax=Leptospira stimsonii TaxID=2202203 RepID=A0A8B3CQS7_9LEPT|nr:hypothetical protein DLM78_09620 [Leptospira stimsonii]